MKIQFILLQSLCAINSYPFSNLFPMVISEKWRKVRTTCLIVIKTNQKNQFVPFVECSLWPLQGIQFLFCSQQEEEQ